MAQPARRRPELRPAGTRNRRGARDRDNDGILPILARTVREVEAAIERGSTPSVRARFQAVALLVRQERARVRGDGKIREVERTEALKRLDGIALILAQTAARDTSLLALLSEDAVVSEAARSAIQGMLRGAGIEAEPELLAPPEPVTAQTQAPRRVVPRSVVARQLANPFLAPDFSAARPVVSCREEMPSVTALTAISTR